MWDHVIKYNETKHLRKTFIKDLLKEMIKNKPSYIKVDEIFSIIEDILRYIKQDEEDEYEINQGIIGIQELLRRHIMKVWKGVDFSKDNYRSLNKILVKHYVYYYNTCWKYKNEWFNNRERQQKRAIEWYKNIKKQVKNKELPQVKLIVRRNELKIERCKTETILQWIYNVKEMIKKVAKLPSNDIRRFFDI